MLRFVRPVLFVCGILILIMSGLMACVAVFAWLRQDPEMEVFLISCGITLASGLLLVVSCRTPGFHLISRQLYLLTSLSWVLLSVVGALPLFFSHFQLSAVDAVFEAVSGITTTGSTVLSGIENLSPSLLLWRSLLQWLGGLGVIGMAVSILPFLRIGGMRLFHTESSDWSDKSIPRIQSLARLLVLTYLTLTVSCTGSYWLAGMNLFDAINHAMATVSTGGFATDDRSMGRFDAPVLWVSTLFMILSALPFTLLIAFARRPSMMLFKNQQVMGFLGILLVVTLLLTVDLINLNLFTPYQAITEAAFNLVSVITTTGFAAGDYTQWGTFSIALSAIAFSFLFFVTLAVVTLLLAMMGLDLLTSLTAAATALTNVGPGLGEIIGPAGNFASLPDAAKWLLSLAMLMGRLELLTLMVLFTPMFWRG